MCNGELLIYFKHYQKIFLLLLFELSLLGPAVAFPIPTLNDLYPTEIGKGVIIAIATPIAQTVATPAKTLFAVSSTPIWSFFKTIALQKKYCPIVHFCKSKLCKCLLY